MISFWEHAATAKLYQQWWGGETEGLLSEGGLYDNGPMLEFFENEFEGLSPKRDVSIGLTDLLSGNYRVLNNSDINSKEDLKGALKASFSFPGVFPPHQGFGSEFVDGTSIISLDVFSAVNACLKKTGGKQEDVLVDVIMTTRD